MLSDNSLTRQSSDTDVVLVLGKDKTGVLALVLVQLFYFFIFILMSNYQNSLNSVMLTKTGGSRQGSDQGLDFQDQGLAHCDL